MRKTVLITGGAGFIGSNFCHYMARRYKDYQLVCLDALTYAGKYENIAPLVEEGRLQFVRGDIAERNAVFSLFDRHGFDWVINFAAESHVDRSIKSADDFVRTNIAGAMVLMDACVRYKTQRFHQVSTDEVYGDLPLDRPDLKFLESSPLIPSNPYSASKASADLMALAYLRTHGLNVTISRCSNNYGIFQHSEKLIPLMILRALKDEPLPVYGNGSNVRDWLHVDDHCAALDLILHQGRIGEVYNIGGNCERDNLSVVRSILAALNKPESLITFVADRPGHDHRYAISFDKIHNELSFSPAISFDKGLSDTISWYKIRQN